MAAGSAGGSSAAISAEWTLLYGAPPKEFHEMPGASSYGILTVHGIFRHLPDQV